MIQKREISRFVIFKITNFDSPQTSISYADMGYSHLHSYLSTILIKAKLR